MKKDWKKEKLESSIRFIDYRGKTPKKTESGIRLITAKNVKLGYLQKEPEEFIEESSFASWMTRGIPKVGDIIFTTEAPLGNVAQIGSSERLAFAQRIIVFQPNRKIIDPSFLKYTLLSESTRSEIFRNATGATVLGIKASLLKRIHISYPPLPEQRRIVSILDECFAAIDKAKANIEQNLKNARELFESYLQGVFENKGEDWEEQYFENCFKLKSGDNLTAKNMSENGDIPVFGGNGIAGYHNEYNLNGSNVIIGRVGALCGNVRHITEPIWLTDNAFRVIDFKFDIDHSFLTYLLNYKDLRSYARQAAQPVISNSSLKDVLLHFPKSIAEQQTIVRQLNAMRTETQKLEKVYQKKLEDLEELRKSVLQKAFSGELNNKILRTL